MHFSTGNFSSPEGGDKEGHICVGVEKGGGDIILQWFWHQGR